MYEMIFTISDQQLILTNYLKFYNYVFQGERIQTLGGMDQKLQKTVKLHEERARKRSKYDSKQKSEASTSQARYVNFPDHQNESILSLYWKQFFTYFN